MTTHASTDGRAAPVSAVAAGPFAAVLPWLGLAAVASAAALVFWVFDALPFQDLPAHAGLIALRHRLSSSPFEQRFFVFAPHLGPYSLFRFLGETLLARFGPVGAVRAIATLPVIVTPLALLWARHRLHGDRTPGTAYFGLALSFGLMTLLGFASYLLGVAVLIVGLTMWLELLAAVDTGDQRARRGEAEVACFAPLIFVTHGYAFAIFLFLALVTALAAGRRAARLMRLRALVPAVGLAGWVAWAQRVSAVAQGSVAPPNPAMRPHFQGVLDKLSLLITPTLMTRTGLDALVGLMLWTVLLMGIIATARSVPTSAGLDHAAAEPRTCTSGIDHAAAEPRTCRPQSSVHARGLLACLAALSVAFLVLPYWIGWFGFVDGRLVLVLLLLAVMTVRRDALGRRLSTFYDWSAPVAACAMTLIAFGASYYFQKEAGGWREVLANVPAGARLLNLPLDPKSDIFTAHPFIHYDKLVLAERPIVVSDVWFHQGSALYPTADNPALRLPPSYSESDLRFIDWPAYRLSDWDFVLMRTRPGSAQPFVPKALALAAHRGGWWLFRTQ
jgi:hypothetical protein